MHEYVTDALVLAIDPAGEVDGRVSLFTPRHGKIVARAKSVRKITSRMASHLRPGNTVRVRVVEKNGPVAADAMKTGALDFPLSVYAGLDAILAEREPEERLWELVTRGAFSWSDALALLGWDPRHAACRSCARGQPAAFRIGTQEFFCAACASAMPRNALLCI